MPIPYDEEHLAPNDDEMEFDESEVNPFDPDVPPFWINDWRVESEEDY